MREAFFEGYDSENIEYFTVEKLGEVLESGQQPVGATFIVPVPPGYPMIAPGQLVTMETITFLKALNPNEILGLDPDLGVRVFKEAYFKAETPARRTAARAKKTGAS
jgi:arginine decarboxylase